MCNTTTTTTTTTTTGRAAAAATAAAVAARAAAARATAAAGAAAAGARAAAAAAAATAGARPNTKTAMIIADSLTMIYEFQNGVDVIDSLLHPDSFSSSILTLDQRDGLHQLKKVLLLASSPEEMGKKKIDTSADLRRSFVESLENQEKNSATDDIATNRYLLFEFGGVKPMQSRWQTMKKNVHKSNSFRRIKKMINNRKNSSFPNFPQQRSYDAPPEWYKLDRETQIQLSNHLSWENLMKWDFDIFEVSKLCNGRPLLFVGWAILASPHSQYIMEQTTLSEAKKGSNGYNTTIGRKGYGFLEAYKISPKCMIDFLRAVEDRYVLENPYHNNIHAADVLQTTHSFLEAMDGKYLGVETQETNLSQSSPMMTLQMFSVLVGAAIHDVGHPGYNNAFQSNSYSQTALTYNDNSVLENYHLSLAFKMILGAKGNADWNIFQGMDPNDFVKCKRLITEAVLGTDLTSHFSKLEEIKSLIPLSTRDRKDINDDDSMSYSWKVMSFLMHMADISNCAKRRSISTQWTDCVLSEFFRQGDKEKELGLPISPLCDRDTTSRPNSQIGFITYIIRPSLEILQHHLPQIGTVVLPLIEGNYEFWQLELQQEKEMKSNAKVLKVINVITSNAA